MTTVRRQRRRFRSHHAIGRVCREPGKPFARHQDPGPAIQCREARRRNGNGFRWTALRPACAACVFVRNRRLRRSPALHADHGCRSLEIRQRPEPSRSLSWRRWPSPPARACISSGLMTPATPTASKTSLSAPEPSKPAPETSKPAPADNVAIAPEPAKPVPPAQPEASAPPAENQPDVAVAQKPQPAKPAEVPSQTEALPKPSATTGSRHPKRRRRQSSRIRWPATVKRRLRRLTRPLQPCQRPRRSQRRRRPSQRSSRAKARATDQPAGGRPRRPCRRPNPLQARRMSRTPRAKRPASPAAKQPDQPVVALNVPKPELPAGRRRQPRNESPGFATSAAATVSMPP